MATVVTAFAVTVAPGTALPGRRDAHVTWSPLNPEPNRDVVFTITAQDPGGVVLRSVVEFGDGSQGSHVPPRSMAKDAAACIFGDDYVSTLRHRYPAVGEYRVRLTVTFGGCPLSDTLSETVWTQQYTLSVSRNGVTRAVPESTDQPQPEPSL